MALALLQHARTPSATSAEATGFLDDVVRSGRPLQRGSGGPGRIVDMHEAVDTLALTDNRNLLLPHLITNIAVAPVPGAGAVEEAVT